MTPTECEVCGFSWADVRPPARLESYLRYDGYWHCVTCRFVTPKQESQAARLSTPEAIRKRGHRPIEDLVEDYNDLRSWGYTDRAIADRLGMSWLSLYRQLNRAHRKGMKVDYYSPTAEALRRL